jgi:hypothetical protein
VGVEEGTLFQKRARRVRLERPLKEGRGFLPSCGGGSFFTDVLREDDD